MENREFEKHWNKRRKAHPDEPRYITLCYLLEGSGEEAVDIYELFDEYIPKKDFLVSERETMVSYLIDIAQDR